MKENELLKRHYSNIVRNYELSEIPKTEQSDGDKYIKHGEWSKHKYIDRIPLGNGRYRYFYSQNQLDAYKRRAKAENEKGKATFVAKTENGMEIPITREDAAEIAYQKKVENRFITKAKKWLIKKGIYNPDAHLE
jgi:hypothetical protein